MFRNGTRIFTRGVAGSCAVLATLAACVVATPSAQASTALAAGNLLVGDNFGNVRHYGADGTLLGSISTGKASLETGACEDRIGRVYQTNFNDGTITRMGPGGTVDATTWASGLSYPESCVVAPNGNVLVGQEGNVVALGSSGSVVATYPVGDAGSGTGSWISLESDNCTLNVAVAVIWQYNICTMSSMGYLTTNSGPPSQNEQLPNGDLLVAAGSDVEEVNASGVVRTYTVPGSALLTCLAIVAAGNAFWVGDSDWGRITKISMSTGNVLQTLTQQTGVGALLVYRGTSSAKNLVALGDSVVAGEGINYGFVWEKGPLGILQWVRTGPSNPTWVDTTRALGKNYKQCHQSSLSYPDLISLGGNYNVYNMACTGVTALQNNTSGLPEDGGVLDAERFDTNGQPYPQTAYTEVFPAKQDPSKTVPAQLGGSCIGCDSRNTYFDEHNPSVVLLTMGANDINFAYWLNKCYNPLVIRGCNTAANTNLLNSQLSIQKLDLATTLRQLNAWATSRKKALRVLVTNYYSPFDPKITNCIDYTGLSSGETAWLINGLRNLNTNIAADVARAKASDTHLNVSLVDLSNVMSGHQWCTPHPWVYGASIDFPIVNGKFVIGHNTSPFHPTPEGQRAIYQAVKAHLP
jgi:hypothetical protein